LTDLVRQRRGQLADRGRARNVRQLSAALGSCQLGRPELGDVRDCTDEPSGFRFIG